MADISQYKVGVVLSVEEKSASGKKALKVCSVDVGEGTITVVTNASNVRDGSRCAVVP